MIISKGKVVSTPIVNLVSYQPVAWKTNNDKFLISTVLKIDHIAKEVYLKEYKVWQPITSLSTLMVEYKIDTIRRVQRPLKYSSWKIAVEEDLIDKDKIVEFETVSLPADPYFLCSITSHRIPPAEFEIQNLTPEEAYSLGYNIGKTANREKYTQEEIFNKYNQFLLQEGLIATDFVEWWRKNI